MKRLARRLWLALTFMFAFPSSTHALELQLEAYAGGGSLAGKRWDATRPAETLGGSAALRLHPAVSLDIRFLTQRLRYHAVDEVSEAGRSYVALFGIQAYPLAQRYRVDPRIGAFAGELSTRATSTMADSSVKLEMRSLVLGLSLGAIVNLGEHFGMGLDGQVLRAFHERACMRAGADTVSCNGVGNTDTYLISAMLSGVLRFH